MWYIASYVKTVDHLWGKTVEKCYNFLLHLLTNMLQINNVVVTWPRVIIYNSYRGAPRYGVLPTCNHVTSTTH
jgi:hypothetical protein